MMEEDKILFDAADVNGDGKLDVVEFLSFSHPEEDPKMIGPGTVVALHQFKGYGVVA